jgi:hypothetical protein
MDLEPGDRPVRRRRQGVHLLRTGPLNPSLRQPVLKNELQHEDTAAIGNSDPMDRIASACPPHHRSPPFGCPFFSSS